MTEKIILGLMALGVQYLLMHTHKAGHSHWMWVALVSVLLFVVGIRWVSTRPNSGVRRATPFITFALLCVVVPPVVYVLGEWMQVPDNVANVFARDPLFYFMSVTAVSGGWLFAIAFLWVWYRSRKTGSGHFGTS